MRSIGVGSTRGVGRGVGLCVGVVVAGRVTGGVVTGLGLGVGLAAGVTLRGRESWVLAAETSPEKASDITAKANARINANLRLFKPLIKSPIATP